MEKRAETVAFGAVSERMPKLSVLIASYRSGEKLYQALESVLVQSYDGFELIVCDDGSEAFERERVEELTKGRRSKLLCHSENFGTVHNLNDGLFLCEGEWVLILAADDALAGNDVLAKIARQAAKTEKEWMIGPALLCGRNLRPTGRTVPARAQTELLRQGDTEKIWGYLCRECFIPSGGAVYRRDLLLRLGGFDSHYRLVEDWPLFLRLIREGRLPEVLDKPVTLHRSEGVSRRSAGNNRSYQRDLIETMQREILPYLDSLPVREREEIRTLCQDKGEIYRLRFEASGPTAKAGWFLTHPGTILRTIRRKGTAREIW